VTVTHGDASDYAHNSKLLARVQTRKTPFRSVMLYGSHARGTANTRSDIDILALDADQSHSVLEQDLTITAYRPNHLRALARNGSLFVLHLIHDGVILYDPNNELSAILAEYRPPADPSLLSAEFTIAASGLIAATDEERRSLGTAIQSLAFYVLRTALYQACVIRGRPQFETGRALEELDLQHIEPVLEERRQEYEKSRLDRVLATLPIVLPGCERPEWPGLAATVVGVAEAWPLASDLLARVLAGGAVDYTALSLPAP